MRHGISTGGGVPMMVTAPTRYYGYRGDGGKYSLSAAADFLADAGFDGADLSLDQPEPDGDEVLRSVLYAFGNRAAARGLAIPVCHLPFYMPSPDDGAAMARFSKEVAAGIRAAAMLGIPDGVIHPIVRHSSSRSRDRWLTDNLSFLTPLRDLAEGLGVRLCVENMAGKPYPFHPTEVIYGSRPLDLLELAEALDLDICWDFGHAHLTGLCQSAALDKLRGRVRVIHVHDNDGRMDTHGIPALPPTSTDRIDWQDAAEGLRLCAFTASPDRCMNMELKSSHLPADRGLRLNHAAHAIAAARKIAEMIL